MEETEIPEDLKQITEQYEDETLDEIDLEQFIRYYEKDLSKGTLVQYTRYLSKVDRELMKEPDKIESWAKEKADDKEFRTKEEDANTLYRFTYNVYLAYRKYLKSVDDDQRLQELPDRRDIRKPQSRPRTNYIEEDQVKKLIEVTDTTRDELAIVLMFYSGLRSYELLNMTPEWLEFREKEILIGIPSEFAKGKRNNPRSEQAILKSDYTDQLKAFIKKRYDFEGEYSELYQEIAEEGEFKPIFDYKDGSEKTFQDLWKERYHLNKMLIDVLEKAEVNEDKISAHDLRRSFIHHQYRNLNDLSKTAQIARHEDPSITQDYLKLDEDELIDTYHEGIS